MYLKKWQKIQYFKNPQQMDDTTLAVLYYSLIGLSSISTVNAKIFTETTPSNTTIKASGKNIVPKAAKTSELTETRNTPGKIESLKSLYITSQSGESPLCFWATVYVSFVFPTNSPSWLKFRINLETGCLFFALFSFFFFPRFQHDGRTDMAHEEPACGCTPRIIVARSGLPTRRLAGRSHRLINFES